MEARGAGRTPALVGAAAVATIAAILAVFVLLRLPFLTTDASVRGWTGDTSIFGLMAKKIRDGRGVDVFYWGQNYMGPLTPAIAAGIRRAVLDPAGAGDEAGPIALRLASMGELAFGICFFVLALARILGRALAAAAGLWMAVGPPFFIRLSGVPMGPEMAFALGSVLFWLAADALTRPQPVLDRPAGRFVFGLVAGAGWWMNQTIFVVLVPAAAVVMWRAGPRRTRFLTPLLAGAVLGYAPVWMGRLLGWYEVHLGAPLPPWRLSSGLSRLPRFLETDAWRFVGLDGVLPAPLLALAALALVAILVRRRPWSAGLSFLATVAGLAAAMSFLLALDARGDRYVTPALPAAVALVLAAVAEATRLLRQKVPVGVAALLPVGLALFAALFLARRARGTVEALVREPDPRAPLVEIAKAGYTVCHASYETAYTLQFLSDERVRFIPYHSYDRNRALSAELRALPGPQCLVTDDGTVRRWLPSDAEQEGGPSRHRAETR